MASVLPSPGQHRVAVDGTLHEHRGVCDPVMYFLVCFSHCFTFLGVCAQSWGRVPSLLAQPSCLESPMGFTFIILY